MSELPEEEDEEWHRENIHLLSSSTDDNRMTNVYDSPFNNWRPRAFVSNTSTRNTQGTLAGGETVAVATTLRNAYLPLPESAWNTVAAAASASPASYASFSHQDSFLRLCRELLDPILRTHRPAQKLHLVRAFLRTLPTNSKLDGASNDHNNDNNDNSSDKSVSGGTATVLYPYLRLLLPHLDRERPNYQLKENKLAQLYREVLAIPPKSPAAQRLVHWKDPRINAMQTETTAFGDVVYALLVERGGCGLPEEGAFGGYRPIDSCSPPLQADGGLFSIGEVNQLLDRLAHLSYVSASTASGGGGGGASSTSSSSSSSVHSQRVELFQVCLRRMSPLEHKWLIRMILLDLKLGINHLSIFKIIHGEAWSVYTRTSSLAAVCEQCSGSPVSRASARKNPGSSADTNEKVVSSVPVGGGGGGAGSGVGGVGVFHSCKPMLAAPFRVQHLETMLQKEERVGVEPKYDGERVLVHIRKGHATPVAASGGDTLVSSTGDAMRTSSAASGQRYRIQYLTRNGKDYTSVYAPTFNPILERHLRYLDFSISDRRAAQAALTSQIPQFFSSCILDGEMMVYDKETTDFTPFGFTRTFAMSAEAARLAEALADENAAPTQRRRAASGVLSHRPSEAEEGGGGPNAQHYAEGGPHHHLKDHSEAVSRHWFCYMVFDILAFNDVSLLEVSLSQRRDVLQFQLGLSVFSPSPSTPSASPLQHHLELVPSTPHTSTTSILQALEHSLLVEKREGIVLKSYRSPYQPGERKPWWWMKLKHDHVAKLADTLDLIVVGAYYGTKFGRRQLTHFLLAAWKSKKPKKQETGSSCPAVKSEPGGGACAQAGAMENVTPSAPATTTGNTRSGPPVDVADENENHSAMDESALFHTVCKVGTGYTDQELTQVLTHLSDHWENPYATARERNAEANLLQQQQSNASGMAGLSPFSLAVSSAPTLSSSAPLPVSQHAPAWLDGWVPAQRELLPDVYIHPKHSVVFEVMGYEFVEETDNYRIGFTLRFPRLLQVRWDKDVQDAASVEEVWAIREASAEQLQAKLQACIDAPGELETVLSSKHKARQKRRQDDEAGVYNVEDGEELSVFEKAARLRRKRAKTEGSLALKSAAKDDPSNTDTVVVKAEGSGDAGVVPSYSQLFKGYEFSILSFRPRPPDAASAANLPTPPATAAQLESLLRRHGARVVANPLPHTTSLLLGDHPQDLRVVNWIAYATKAVVPSQTNRTKAGAEKKKSFVNTDVVRWDYVLECLVAHKIVPLTPRHMLYVSPALRQKFDVLYDEYEDSYYEDASLESLRHSLELVRQKSRVSPQRAAERMEKEEPDGIGMSSSSSSNTAKEHRNEEKGMMATSSLSCVQWVNTWNRVHETEEELFTAEENGKEEEEEPEVDHHHHQHHHHHHHHQQQQQQQQHNMNNEKKTVHVHAPAEKDNALVLPLPSAAPCRYAAVSWSAFECFTKENGIVTRAPPLAGPTGPSASPGLLTQHHSALLENWGRRWSRRHILHQFQAWMRRTNQLKPSEGVEGWDLMDPYFAEKRMPSRNDDDGGGEGMALLLEESPPAPPSGLFLLGEEEEEEVEAQKVHPGGDRECPSAIHDAPPPQGSVPATPAMRTRSTTTVLRHNDSNGGDGSNNTGTELQPVLRGVSVAAPLHPLPPSEWSIAQCHRMLMLSITKRRTSCIAPFSTPDNSTSFTTANDPTSTSVITHVVDPYGNVYRLSV